MPRAIFIILIVSGVSGYLFSKYFYKPTSSQAYKILETLDFSCPGMTGFTFKYPVFEGWEVKKIERELEIDVCHIYLNQPKNVQLEISPQITVSKIAELNFEAGSTEEIEMDKNPTNIYFTYRPTEPHYAIFYTKDYGVRIDSQSIPQNLGFSEDIFFKTVIESFRVGEK